MFDGITGKLKTAGHALSKGNVEYPTKTTINLACVEKESSFRPATALLLAVVLVVIVLLFAKFAVVDLLSASSKANSELSLLQTQLTELQEANSDYSDLKQELESYSAPGMTDDEKTYSNREHALMLASAVSGLGSQLVSISLSGNIMQVQIENSSLDTVSSIVEKLSKYKWVESVHPNNAQTDPETNKVTSTITINLTPATQSASSQGEE